MFFFQRKPKCPNCNLELQTRPSRKENCPYCGDFILVRHGKLVTEEQAKVMDWLVRLEIFGVTRRDFDRQREALSKQFGNRASVNDTVWRILNNLILRLGKSSVLLEQVYREMASLASNEGKDPTQYLIQAKKVGGRFQNASAIPQKQVFLAHDELRYIRQLRKEGKIDKADALLLKAEPTPAVLDELRKNASVKARNAKKDGDWVAVVKHLESYTAYAQKWRDFCVKIVKQEPPAHTESDFKLLHYAKERLTSNTISQINTSLNQD
ncbi:MAG: hypothetical protein C4583_19210 [Anaerolineaceae bacterium]|nr:MAG: hypothetical protein C4583_19210 [Anaerolineaceae bacterium]